METLPKSQLLRFVEQAMHLARRAVARYSSKFSKRRYTLHQHIVLLCLKVRKNTTYRALLDELSEMPRIWNALDLEELPSPSTLCKAFNRLDMAAWRVLLNLSVTLLPTNGVVGIDASGFDRSHASKLHKANEIDHSTAESHAPRRHEGERDYRRTRDDDTKARLKDSAVAHRAEYRESSGSPWR